MSFETATVFLMDATLQKQSDYLESPSARIVMGRIVEMGTGSFDLLQKIDTLIESQGWVLVSPLICRLSPHNKDTFLDLLSLYGL